MNACGEGRRVPFAVAGLGGPGVWTPRPWSASHPDTGSGDPSFATAEKGRAWFEAACDALARVIVGMSEARRGQSPYL